jgi:hypothetical protein
VVEGLQILRSRVLQEYPVKKRPEWVVSGALGEASNGTFRRSVSEVGFSHLNFETRANALFWWRDMVWSLVNNAEPAETTLTGRPSSDFEEVKRDALRT